MLVDILEEHVDDAADLYWRRQLAFQMLDLTLRDLREMEGRLRASLDGLLVGGDSAWELTRPFLEDGDEEQRFVAASVALEIGDPDKLRVLEEAAAGSDAASLKPIQVAARMATRPHVAQYLRTSLKSASPAVRAVALDALIDRREEVREAISSGLKSESAPELSAALHGAGVYRLRKHTRAVEAHAVSEVPEAANVALESLILLDPALARRRSREAFEAQSPSAAAAARVLGIVGEVDDVELLAGGTKAENPEVQREAVLALGNLGFPAGVPSLLEILDQDGVGRTAGFAIRRILGDGGVGEIPDRYESETGDDDAGIWSPDSDLPQVDAGAARQRWAGNSSETPHHVRHRRGEEFRPAAPTENTATKLVGIEAFELAMKVERAKLPVGPRV